MSAPPLRDDQLVAVHAAVVADGPAAGCRAIDVRVAGGIDLRILPDRGADLGAAWSRGVPLAWISAVGERPPLDHLAGDAWVTAFGGGLLTTCGRRNVGAPSEGHGLHGAASHVRAHVVAAGPARVDGALAAVVQATMRETSALGPCLATHRTITTWAGAGRVRVVDRTRNLGTRPEPAPVLYHVNLGAPLWAPGATLTLDGHRDVEPRDADAAAAVSAWDRAPAPDETPERVFEHALEPAGRGVARVRQPALGLTVTVTWARDALPRLHQWLQTSDGAYVLGIEPANCSLLGRAADRAAGTLPILAPGGERVTEVEIAAAWDGDQRSGAEATSNSTSSP
jgi:uncharacterized protein DUF4432